MTGQEIHKLYFEFMSLFEDWYYVSRADVFKRALDSGLINKETFEEAREYYGSLWEYTGD